ncbi:unnamed protein product [Cuscuta europaea]|uniref:Uncharacterized protein n=1 Tax=Cuscuta europaea TaxID=41803 RepID=A0A9P1EK18_CUSEU|nr:unnamed protein product [Cuscuta europaea]
MDLVSEYQMMLNAEEHDNAEASERVLDVRPITEIPVLRAKPKRELKKVSKGQEKKQKIKPDRAKNKASKKQISNVEATEQHEGQTEQNDNVEAVHNVDVERNNVEDDGTNQPDQNEAEEDENVEEQHSGDVESSKPDEHGAKENEQTMTQNDQNENVEAAKEDGLQKKKVESKKRNRKNSKQSGEQATSSKQNFRSSGLECEDERPKKRITRSTTGEKTENKIVEVKKKKKEDAARKKGKCEAETSKAEKRKSKKKRVEEEEIEDEDEEEEKEENDQFPKLWTRMSPRSITEIMTAMSEEQKAEVVEMGFGPLLNLQIKQLPMQLAYWTVENFDSRSLSLVLPNNEKLRTNEDAVHFTLGFPKGDLNVKNLIDT